MIPIPCAVPLHVTGMTSFIANALASTLNLHAVHNQAAAALSMNRDLPERLVKGT